MALFRKEALDARQAKWLGDVVLVRPLSFTILTLLILTLITLLCAVLLFATYTKRTTVSGELVPVKGQSKVHTPQPGVVLEKYVKEGQLVKRGAPLFTISSERYDSNAGPVHAGISRQLTHQRDLLEGELEKVRQLHRDERHTLTNHLSSLKKELQALTAQSVSQRSLLSLSTDASERYRALADKGYISRDQLQQRQTEQIAHQKTLQMLSRERTALVQQLLERTNDLSGLESRQANQIAQIGRQLATLEQHLSESEARRTLLITAPESGIATAVLAEVGHNVDGGRPLLSIVPADSPLQAELYAPSRSIGFIKPGDTVKIRYQAFPYQKFGLYQGEVLSISRTSISQAELGGRGNGNHGMREGGEQLYRLHVRLAQQSVTTYGKQSPLQSGMLLEGDILQEKRRLYEWVLDPLYSLTGKF